MKNNIKLNILPSSSDSAVHLEMCFNADKDNGVLYFTSDEYDDFVDLLMKSDAIIEINDNRINETTQEYNY